MYATLDNPVDTLVPFSHGVAKDPEPCLETRKLRRPRILLAEDDQEMRRFLTETLRRSGYNVMEVRNGYGMLDFIGKGLASEAGIDLDLVISDIRMPGANGLRILSALHSHCPTLPVILITAFGNPETHEEAKLRGAIAVLDKPFSLNELLAILQYALQRKNTTRKGPGLHDPERSNQ
ncbi:MAG TPA: response regulator [Phycisphaerae bacterium]|nr:response regulator [Phycisphaerae bacterium]